MKRHDVIVIGGGVVGSAILYELAKQGITNVLLLEKKVFGSGSTAKSGGFIRCYHQDPYLSDLAVESFPTFLEIAESIDYVETGFMFLETPEKVAAMQQEVKRMAASGYLIEELTPEEGKGKFPAFQWDGVGGAVYEPQAGYANPIRVSNYWVTKARELGASAWEGVQVEEIIVLANKIVGVRTSCGELYADTVILAAGAWSKGLVAPLGIELNSRNKAIQIHFFTRTEENRQHPSFIDDTTDLYGRMEAGGLSLLGHPVDHWDIDPDVEYPFDAVTLATIHEKAPNRIKGISSPSFSGGRYGFDAYTPDYRGIMEVVPEWSNLILATGWSGGGFKCSPAIARRVVELAVLQKGLLPRTEPHHSP